MRRKSALRVFHPHPFLGSSGPTPSGGCNAKTNSWLLCGAPSITTTVLSERVIFETDLDLNLTAMSVPPVLARGRMRRIRHPIWQYVVVILTPFTPASNFATPLSARIRGVVLAGPNFFDPGAQLIAAIDTVKATASSLAKGTQALSHQANRTTFSPLSALYEVSPDTPFL